MAGAGGAGGLAPGWSGGCAEEEEGCMPDRWIRRAAEWRWLVGESWLVLVLMVAAWWGLAMWVGRGDAVMVIWDLTERVRGLATM